VKQYLDLMHHILTTGRDRGDRTGVGTRSIFSARLIHDMRKGFPLLTTKKMRWDWIWLELEWFLRGDSDITFLKENGVSIWDDWALPNDVLRERELSNYERLSLYCERTGMVRTQAQAMLHQIGSEEKGHLFLDQCGIPRCADEVLVKAGSLNSPYGPAWRHWKGRGGKEYDQIAYVLNLLRTNPESRRMVVSCWDPANMPDESISPQDNVINGKPALTPCHYGFELYTEELTFDERLDWLSCEALETYSEYQQYVKSIVGRLDVHVDTPTYMALLGKWFDTHNVPKRFLDLKWHQRSNDFLLGDPYNLASYAFLLTIFAKTVNMIPRMLEGDLTNVHIYRPHMEGAIQQYSRTPRDLPELIVNVTHDKLEDYRLSDFELVGYNPHPFIRFARAV